MSEITSPILFEAAVSYANETSDASIRGDLRIAFVAGAEWQWKRVSDEEAVARLEAENERLRKALRGVAGYSTMVFRDWSAEFPELSKATTGKPMSQYASIFARHSAAALEPKP